jgi:hypothetical protein
LGTEVLSILQVAVSISAEEGADDGDEEEDESLVDVESDDADVDDRERVEGLVFRG